MKPTANDIEDFVRDLFHWLYIDCAHCVGYASPDDEYDFSPNPIEKHGKLQKKTLAKAAKSLGLPIEALMQLDGQEISSWMTKYPYFKLRSEFEKELEKLRYGPRLAEHRLLKAILGDQIHNHDVLPVQYNYRSVYQRLFELLRQMDKEVPGTFHEGAAMQGLRIRTAQFCHFSKIKELCDSYLEMVKRENELFQAALTNELSENEISEFNRLASVLELEDRYDPDQYLYYDRLVKYRGVYQAEGVVEIGDTVRLSPFGSFAPYRCAEFLDDIETVQKFVNLYPSMKKDMREFAMAVSKFQFRFKWSDAAPAQPETVELPGLGMTVEVGPDPFNPPDETVIFVPKTDEELGTDKEYVERLKAVSSSTSIGGLRVPYTPSEESDREMIARVWARSNARGGEDDE